MCNCIMKPIYFVSYLYCMLLFGMTGVTLAEKWTTDNVLTTQITVEDQVVKLLSLLTLLLLLLLLLF